MLCLASVLFTKPNPKCESSGCSTVVEHLFHVLEIVTSNSCTRQVMNNRDRLELNNRDRLVMNYRDRLVDEQ